MDSVYGAAGLLAWNPWLAFGVLAATAVLRTAGWKSPAWLALIAVGASIGLSLGLPGCVVTPPPNSTPQNPWLVAMWVALLTAAAEWRAPRKAETFWKLPPAAHVLVETIFSTALFLGVVWRPTVAGWLAGLFAGYGVLLGIAALVDRLRQRTVQRLTLRAAADGSTAAHYAAWQAGWLPVPVPWAVNAARNSPERSFRPIRRGALVPLGLLCIAGCVSLVWLTAPAATVDPVTADNWKVRRLTNNLLTDFLVAATDDVTARAENLRQNAPSVLDATTLDLTAEAELYRHNEVSSTQWWRLWCAVARAEFGLDPQLSRRGEFVRAYISPVDGSTQRYGVWVPPSYDPARPLPLLLWLHGHMGWSEFGGWNIPDELCTGDAIVISPQARGSLDYVGIQANEVWRTVEEVRQTYAVDPDRIYAAGHSMGGTGAWYLATQRPEFFAAVAPGSPNLSPWAWRGASPPQDEDCHDLVVRLQRTEASIGYANRLIRMPFLASHGAKDPVVPVQNSRQMVAAIRNARVRAGLPATDPDQIYVEYPLGNHGTHIAAADCLRWLLTHRRPAPPPLVHTAGGLEKTQELAPPPPAYGPIYRAFDEPFVLVIPDECRRFLVVEPQDDRELALQQIAREVVAFETTWQAHYHHPAPVVTASAYLTKPADTGRANAPELPRHPVLLGGPDVNLATALLLEGDGPLADYQVPAGIDVHEDHLTADGATATQPAVLLAIVPPR
ncbi:MAG TPA: prolyl oligopeptidase family serine peptidase, partial [Planctomycetota bacterium]|nr:prolyl oligopeptidase family serine peptidase [Planctomycetota bacterium]